ncbi:hypothetical protein BJY01DRAFT_251427 [Aspergillus pseudoustus]|uniref:DUF6891 domain-containing protein n=1 Tax=Aspergillus pseudoustus TaxID=1810923 RepID=A0ABR4JCJ6_9EURO
MFMEIDADARRFITWRVRSGFYTSDEIVDTVAQWIVDEQPETTLSQAKRAIRPIVGLEWAGQLERQQSWPRDQPTISDKLSKAFASLERNHGILARMNLACCQTCGIAEISGDSDEDTRGYVFFHAQDTETVALEGGDLSLAFGSFTKSERRNRAIGDVTVKSLRRAGLSVEWDGDAAKRITVHCEQWRRRIGEDEEVQDVGDEDFDTECFSSDESDSALESVGISDVEAEEMGLLRR